MFFQSIPTSIGILKKINIRLFHDYSTIIKHKACGSLCSPNNIDSNTRSWRFFNLLYTPEVYVTFIFNLLKVRRDLYLPLFFLKNAGLRNVKISTT